MDAPGCVVEWCVPVALVGGRPGAPSPGRSGAYRRRLAAGGWTRSQARAEFPGASPWGTVEEDLHTTLAGPAGRRDDLAAVTLSGAFA